MTVYMTADHNGLRLKNTLRDWLVEEGYVVEDLGPETFNKDDDYPDFGITLAKRVAAGGDDTFGIAICGSGVGMAVVANKVPGVRAGLIHDPAIAAAARRDDDINVLALGASYITAAQAKSIVAAWLSAEFSGEERHRRRIDKLTHYEQTERS